MDLLDVAIYSLGFGCGWVASKFFFPDNSDLEESDQMNIIENPIQRPTRSRASSRYRKRMCGSKRRQCNRYRYRRCLSVRKIERERLLEAFKEHTSSIENLDATLTCLNETLKKAEVVNHTREEEKEIECNIIEEESDILPPGLSAQRVCRRESTPKNSGLKYGSVDASVLDQLKNPGLKVLFPSDTNPLQPDFGGGGPKDRSAGMHIYDDGFEAPKCKENPWTLNTFSNEVIGENMSDLLDSSKPKPREVRKENPPSIHDELQGMFQDCRTGDSKLKEIDLLTKPGGGYASIGDLNKMKKEGASSAPPLPKKRSKSSSKGLAIPVLSRGDELDIINSFSSMKGMGWEEAVNMAQEQGYNLHPTYINNIPNLASEYSKTVLGVKVKDTAFDTRLGSDAKGLSKEAVVISVVDVGGMDLNGRGL